MQKEHKSACMNRSDYTLDKTRLNDFNSLTDNCQTVLHRLVKASHIISFKDKDDKVHTLTSLLENNILTVLADIKRKRFSEYDNSFVGAQGTIGQQIFVRKLENDIERWIVRLDTFIRNNAIIYSDECTSLNVSKDLRDTLLKCLIESKKTIGEHRFYLMLRTVDELQQRVSEYESKIEEYADIDPAISLLYSFVRNYCTVAGSFNKSFAQLPDIYRKTILPYRPKSSSADYAYLLITPKEDTADFTLSKNTAFTVDENLSYKTIRKETITNLHCVENRPLSTKNPSKDFGTIGWQIESAILVMEEGTRKIDICMVLNSSTYLIDNPTNEGLTVQYSSTEKWTNAVTECIIQDGCLHFHITIERDMPAPKRCDIETHGIETTFPVIRLMTSPDKEAYQWAKTISFDYLSINVDVTGIKEFSFYNDLGDVDTTQSFAAFGLQAEKGSWFIFGKDELGKKELIEVTLHGNWQKISDTKSGFDQRYHDYGIDSSSFDVSIEYRKQEQWGEVGSQKLFSYDSNGKLLPAKISIIFTDDYGVSCGEQPCRDGFFRVTLASPEIGFGAEKYRTLFTQVMMENSKNKKDVIATPSTPYVPYLVNVELSYKAQAYIYIEDSIKDAVVQNVAKEISLSRIMEFSDKETFPLSDNMEQPLMPAFLSDDIQYFAFSNAVGRNVLRFYIDAVLPEAKIPFDIARPGDNVFLSWELWNGRDWIAIPQENIKNEETKGFTQSGYVEIALPEIVQAYWLDEEGKFWIRAGKSDNAFACLDIRNVWTNYVKVVAETGFLEPLPAGTIQQMVDTDERIASVNQPYETFGGTSEENEEQYAVRQTAGFSHRNRAVTQKDYELLLLELFPDVDKVQCISVPRKKSGELPEVCLVVYSRKEDDKYYLSSAWRMSEIEHIIKQYTPACVNLRVTNPQYERLRISCVATLYLEVADKGKVLAELSSIIEYYFMPWRAKGDYPISGVAFSFQELYSRIVNHENIKKIVSLEIDGRELPDDACPDKDKDVIIGEHPWSVLLPDINIKLLVPDDGIGNNGIGEDFVIG